MQILKSVAIPVDLNDRDTLIKSATTSLSSKVISMHSSLLAPMAVDCVLAVSEDCRKYAAPPRRASPSAILLSPPSSSPAQFLVSAPTTTRMGVPYGAQFSAYSPPWVRTLCAILFLVNPTDFPWGSPLPHRNVVE